MSFSLQLGSKSIGFWVKCFVRWGIWVLYSTELGVSPMSRNPKSNGLEIREAPKMKMKQKLKLNLKLILNANANEGSTLCWTVGGVSRVGVSGWYEWVVRVGGKSGWWGFVGCFLFFGIHCATKTIVCVGLGRSATFSRVANAWELYLRLPLWASRVYLPLTLSLSLSISFYLFPAHLLLISWRRRATVLAAPSAMFVKLLALFGGKNTIFFGKNRRRRRKEELPLRDAHPPPPFSIFFFFVVGSRSRGHISPRALSSNGWVGSLVYFTQIILNLFRFTLHTPQD